MAARFTGFRLPPVLLSASNDVFVNLAFENWLYRNVDYGERGAQLLLWRNDRCVVIGRHQNPWLEVSLEAARRLGAPLARRESGGGTVYHDLGNLNCTFFTSRIGYNRKRNLDVVCRAIRRRWQLDVDVAERENIVLDGRYKISGTAAKLGRNNAYHHCTLLLNADRAALSSSLSKDIDSNVQSKATKSVKSEVKNLADVEPSANFENVVSEIGKEFMRNTGQVSNQDQDVRLVLPTEEEFPGLLDTTAVLKSWDWIFGKTPRFIAREPLPETDPPRFLSVAVAGGKIESVSPEWTPADSSTVYALLGETLKGERLCAQTISSVMAQMETSNRSGKESESFRRAAQCLENILVKLHL